MTKKIARLGARKEKDSTLKCRPLRFSVNNMATKGKLLKASMALRSCGDELFNNIYFTPDLAEKQRDEAFKLRQKKRHILTDFGERNRQTCENRWNPEKKEGDSDDHHRVSGPHLGAEA